MLTETYKTANKEAKDTKIALAAEVSRIISKIEKSIPSGMPEIKTEYFNTSKGGIVYLNESGRYATEIANLVSFFEKQDKLHLQSTIQDLINQVNSELALLALKETKLTNKYQTQLTSLSVFKDI